MGDFNQIEFLNQKMEGLNYIPGNEQLFAWKSQLGLTFSMGRLSLGVITDLRRHGSTSAWIEHMQQKIGSKSILKQ